MFLTPYTHNEKIGSSPDPLGFLEPTSKLADILLPQFTVMTNHPSYFGLLCSIYSLKKYADQRPFQHLARDIENIWILINLEKSRTEKKVINGVLNSERAGKFLAKQSAPITINTIRKAKNLYNSLSYGVLAYYRSPAVTWNLLDSNDCLTSYGIELAEAWSAKNSRYNFFKLIKKVLIDNEKTINLKNYFDYALDMDLSEVEKEIWRELIKNQMIDEKTIQLWKTLPVADNEWDYDKLQMGNLNNIITLYKKYEELTALITFAFDYEYTKKLKEKESNINGANAKLQDLIVEELKKLYPDVKKGLEDYDITIKTTVITTSYNDFINNVIMYHIKHQKAKQAPCYFDTDKNPCNGKDTIETLLNELNNLTTENIKQKIIHEYPKNYFFNKAIFWKKLTGFTSK